jgi:hypothetical protein
MLATRPRFMGSKPGGDSRYLRAIRILSTTSLGWKVKVVDPCKILQQVKDHCDLV